MSRYILATQDEALAPAAKKRKLFSPEEEDLVKSYFKTDERSTSAKCSECAAFLSEKQSADLFVGRTVQNIQDKVKNLMKRKQKK